MQIEDVQQLTPAERFLYWIQEREAVRLRRDAGEDRPWTDDQIIDTYRFCNVRRMDDRVSMWLLNNWYLPHRGHRNILRAVALARFFNLPSSLEAITHHVFANHLRADAIKNTLRYLRDDVGRTVFNSAYIVRGHVKADGEDKIEAVVDSYVGRLPPSRDIIRPSSMKDTWSRLLPCYGFGSFMAGQVVADLRWAMPGTWMDKDTWAPPGPGSMRGLNRFLERPLKTAYAAEEFADYLGCIIDSAGVLLPPEVAGRMEAHDWQNCLCEFDKYERALWGEGRPKSLYRPQQES